MTQEHKRKISEALKGKMPKYVPCGWNKGLSCSEKTKQAVSLANKGNTYRKGKKTGFVPLSAFKKGSTPWNKGKKMPEISGENNYQWIDDRTKLQKYNDINKDRRSSMYRDWRKQIWLRDNFKCKIANPDCKGRLEAHHILSYTDYPELRYDPNNGITLCHAHHPRKRAEEQLLIPTFMGLIKSEVIF